MKVVLSRAAAREFALAADWYEERTENQGIRFAEAVEAVLASLPRAPRRPLRGFEDIGMQVVAFPKKWPYRVFCVERGDVLTVVAIAHNRREPGYWLPRLDEGQV